jgi:predicted O-methyltransferase YrrM
MMKIILNCLENAQYFIETGLWLGYTSYFVAKNFVNIHCYSCEINPDFFEIAKSNIGILNNLKIELNKSPDALYTLNKIYDDEIFNKYTIF